MWKFAWRNLLTRPLRTILALIGLSVPILGVLGLFSVSGGLRNLVGTTLDQIQGLIIVRENALSPVFSNLPANLEPRLRAVPGVRAVAAEILDTAPPIEGRSAMLNSTADLVNPLKSRQQKMQSVLDMPLIEGQDIPAHEDTRGSVFPRKMLPPEQGGGRFLNRSDIGKPHIVISSKLARDFPVVGADGTERPRQVGDSLAIGGRPFTIVGLYDTGSMFLDVVILMDIDVARQVLGLGADTVSNYYVESMDPDGLDAVAAAIEAEITEPPLDARSMTEFSDNFGRLLGQLDTFLLMVVSLALLVGVVGIINTMLMSTTERFAEFGVLRTNGWSKGNVLGLVTAESAFLGLMAGAIGCVLAVLGTTIANQFIGGGLRLVVTPSLLLLGLGLSVAMGTLGGLYPAWRAARLVPMEAIRLGAQ
jgi:putative ABC transport system permease protein